MLRRTRPFLVAAYLVALAGFTWKVAVPVSLQYLVLWLSAAMLVASVGNPLGWVKGMFLDWLPLYIILICYSSVRGVADNLGEAPHEIGHVHLTGALARPTLEAIGVEETHEQLEVGVTAIVRRR